MISAGEVGGCPPSVVQFCDKLLDKAANDAQSAEAATAYMKCVLKGKMPEGTPQTEQALLTRFEHDPFALPKVLANACVRFTSIHHHYVKTDEGYRLEPAGQIDYSYWATLNKIIKDEFALNLFDVSAPRFAIADSIPIYLSLAEPLDGKRYSADEVITILKTALQHVEKITTPEQRQQAGISIVFRYYPDRDRKAFAEILGRVANELKPYLNSGVSVSILINRNEDNPDFQQILYGEVDAQQAGDVVVITADVNATKIAPESKLVAGRGFFPLPPNTPITPSAGEAYEGNLEFESRYPADKGIKKDIEDILERKQPSARLKVDIREGTHPYHGYYRRSDGSLMSVNEIVYDMLGEIVTQSVHARKIVYTFPEPKARQGYEASGEKEQIIALYKNVEKHFREVLAAHPDLKFVNPRVEFRLGSDNEIVMRKKKAEEFFSFKAFKAKNPDVFMSPDRFFSKIFYQNQDAVDQDIPSVVPIAEAAQRCVDGDMALCAQNASFARYFAADKIPNKPDDEEGLLTYESSGAEYPARLYAVALSPYSMQYYRPSPDSATAWQGSPLLIDVVPMAEKVKPLQDFYKDSKQLGKPKEVSLLLLDDGILEQNFRELGAAVNALPQHGEIALRINFKE